MADNPTTYGDFTDEAAAPDAEAIKRLSNMAAKLTDADLTVAQAEEALKKAQDDQRDLAERQLPQLMDELGLKEFVTSAGLHISVDERLRVSVPAARKDQAYKWLDDNGHSGLIKRQVSVAFNRGEEEKAAQLIKQIQPDFPDVKTDLTVAPATLKAFVAAQLREGKEIPMKLFGVFQQRFAKVRTK